MKIRGIGFVLEIDPADYPQSVCIKLQLKQLRRDTTHDAVAESPELTTRGLRLCEVIAELQGNGDRRFGIRLPVALSV